MSRYRVKMLQWKTLNFDAVNGLWSFDCFYHLLTMFHVVRVSFVDEMVHGQTYGQISSNMLFSLACVSSETHNLQAVFILSI